jgi:3-phosphoshikimate 1-carboxyvinyltransferase
VYLTADAHQRAQRRANQLLERGQPAILEDLLCAIEERDRQDMTRPFAPLKPAKDALLLDNSALTIPASLATVLNWWQAKQP